MYTLHRLLEQARHLGGDWKTEFSVDSLLVYIEEALAEFFAKDWSFNIGEGSITTRAPHSDGTITVTNGDATVTGVATNWLTTFPTPAIIRINADSGATYLVGTFTSATELELDTEWAGDTEAGVTYEILFHAFDIPAYTSIKALTTQIGQWVPVYTVTYEDMLQWRDIWVSGSAPVSYYVVPGDGTRSTKLFIMPPPSEVYVSRFVYRREVPDFKMYNKGFATVTNASPDVDGTSTSWAKLGFNLQGMIFEMNAQPFNSGVVLTVTDDTNIILATNWVGATVATPSSYGISPQLFIPDDCRPVILNLLRSIMARDADPDRFPLFRGAYVKQMNEAMSRHGRSNDGDIRGIGEGLTRDFAKNGPGIPTILSVQFNP